MQRTFSNKWLKGLNLDLDKAITPQENYVAANDLSLTGDGKFLSLENIGGTQKVGTLLSSFVGESTVLGVFANKYKIDGVSNIECLTVFTAIPSGNFTIYCYRLDTNAVITLYAESYSAAFQASLPAIDALVYPENEIDILYFADGYSELRKLRCEILTAIPAGRTTPLVKEDLSLQRRGTLANVSLSAVSTGGTLLSGSYQFSIRFYNNTTRTYSKWTIPSAPVVITKATLSTEKGLAGYNLNTTKKITINVASYTEYTSLYTHFQFAVIENTGPTSQTIASLQKIQTISSSFTWDYKNNTKIGEVPLSDIVVDLAAVQTARTLAIKNNRIFVGNVDYWNRDDYDRTPTVTGSVTKTVVTDNKDDFQTSSAKGYFRDEVYRFYVSYFDEFYNFSSPKKLDMSAITGNQIVNGDIRFPKGRGGTYHVTNTGYQYLNLSLTVNNHPSWSKGFVILRAKRKKRIQFQTPVIPMCEIEGIDTQGNYPNTVNLSNGSGATTTKSLPSATPMNAAGTWMPKNLFWTANRNIRKFLQDYTGIKKGWVYYEYAQTSTLHTVFPQSSMYVTDSAETSEYTFQPGHVLESLDVAFLKATRNDKTISPLTSGNTVSTSVHSTFYAKEGDYYFCYNGTQGTTPFGDVTDPTSKITAYKPLDNYGAGTTLNGKYVGMYENLDTPGLPWFQKPNNQKMGIIEIPAGRTDASYYTSPDVTALQTNLGGSPNATVTPGFYPASHSVFTTPAGSQLILDPAPNDFVTNKAGFSANSSYATAVEIANVTNGYDDTRYGSDDELHDIITTGAMVVFSASEAATVLSSGILPKTVAVAGGDSYVSSHAFKLTDNHYMVEGATNVNSSPRVNEGGASLVSRWTYYFEVPAINVFMTIPVGGKNISQVVQVILESEYNGETTGIVPYTTYTNSVVDSTEEATWRVNFGYPYHFGLLRAADQKAFTPYNANLTITTSYPSRILYSDQKVYNTDISGFDVFRVASFKDLEDTYRGITKLSMVADNLFAIQAKGVVYVPVDSNIIETADSNQLSIRSGDVIGIPQYISRQFGTQHVKSVIAQDNFVIFTDNINKAILRLSGQQVDNISDIGVATAFRTILAQSLLQNNIYSFYDNRNRQYLIYSNTGTFCYVWDDRLQQWIGTQSYNSQNRLYDGVYFNNYLYVLGRNSANDLNVYKMYEGTPGQLFGNIITPSITFSVNDQFDVPKTFDNFVVYSSDKLDTADITSEKEPSVVVQEVLDQDIEVDRREGAYRVAILRDANDARIRGTRATVKLKWKTLDSHDESAPATVAKVSLSGCITKYRESNRTI